VTNLYVRDSLLIDMTVDDKTRRGRGSTRRDQIGKVFIVVGQDVRKCLICDGVFMRQGAAEHANAACSSGPTPLPQKVARLIASPEPER
jgi:hypothetical protein